MSATATSRFECGVCWQVYDPEAGDPVWQIAPGTLFEELPDEWCCPNCDAPRSKFLRVTDDG
nr:rubredoxin [uncultured Rhodopila sp.]